MKYIGSKRRIAKDILKVILKNRKDEMFVEPFCGGCNLTEFVNGERWCNDINNYVVSLFKAITCGWIPHKYVSEDEYKKIKNNKSFYDPALVGYVGFNSYGAKFFGGYRRDKEGKRDYWDEHYRHLMKQKESLKDIKWTNLHYEDVLPRNSIVYCDPPYEGCLGYDGLEFCSKSFWSYVRKLNHLGNKVYVSEYSCPDDFICVWSKEINNTLDKNTGSKKGIEKLFKYGGE